VAPSTRRFSILFSFNFFVNNTESWPKIAEHHTYLFHSQVKGLQKLLENTPFTKSDPLVVFKIQLNQPSQKYQSIKVIVWLQKTPSFIWLCYFNDLFRYVL